MSSIAKSRSGLSSDQFGKGLRRVEAFRFHSTPVFSFAAVAPLWFSRVATRCDGRQPHSLQPISLSLPLIFFFQDSGRFTQLHSICVLLLYRNLNKRGADPTPATGFRQPDLAVVMEDSCVVLFPTT
ncbi:hypothetical protein Hdeb2414_s0020g00564881 [Helianthus debilis subsp. tardiflorus]